MPRHSPWLPQLREGGLIMVNLHRGLGGDCIALLTVSGGQATGPILPFAGGFLASRTQAALSPSHLFAAVRTQPGSAVRPAAARVRVDVAVLGDENFRAFAALRMAAWQATRPQDDGRRAQRWLVAADGSWAWQARADNGQLTGAQGGQARLWDQLESCYADWIALGRPGRGSLGLTVSGSASTRSGTGPRTVLAGRSRRRGR